MKASIFAPDAFQIVCNYPKHRAALLGHTECTAINPMPISQAVRQRILANLDAGRLPIDAPRKMYAGYGQGNPCDGCGEIIGPTLVEYEATYEDGRAYRVHLACAGLWEVERSRRRP